MPTVEYTVDQVDGVWTVALGEKRFGPYSTMDKAVAAAVAAADKAEAQGYEAMVTINAAPEPNAAEPDAA
ncbi:hypothetical protein [Phenylobacterium sp.]|uniref:hypothetical protein n=1 Tax=Phenylobacterium sp. TaxID=1871053 RepID=UPI0025FDA04B|nr:hypothetical protein [Phenylobacterium sp.]MBX3482566.1 hypothetical protein [Phenylobacterium sp.]MCW5760249.1 hypothetical protein [Phenylobacterium sp.]